jgi:hypothetical protein
MANHPRAKARGAEASARTRLPTTPLRGGNGTRTTVASDGPVYSRRQPEQTALYQVLQQHLLTFEQKWTDKSDGRTLPKFVTEELHKYLDCGILARGFAHLYCDDCGEHHVVAFSCKARAVSPSCLGRRMSVAVQHLHRNPVSFLELRDRLPVGVVVRLRERRGT